MVYIIPFLPSASHPPSPPSTRFLEKSPRMLSQLFFAGALAASLPHLALGNSFSIPLQKVKVPGQIRLPVNGHRANGGTTSTPEIDDQVGNMPP